jgi:6-pyruvoyltetrahydropterin/6-carboxytetrahydropterin synthase
MSQNPNLIYMSSKTYTHSVGLSCCFRQWRAEHSHCHFLHGYALKVELIWEGDLDDKNWVKDFGSLGHVKRFLEATFDHKTIVAKDDPYLGEFQKLHGMGMLDMIQLDDVGAEKFAEYIFETVQFMFEGSGDKNQPKLLSVQVWEHEGNSAMVMRRVQ